VKLLPVVLLPSTGSGFAYANAALAAARGGLLYVHFCITAGFDRLTG